MSESTGVAVSAATESVLVLDGHCTSPALLGGKGAALDRLIGWGVRVPPTAIVTAAAYRTVASQPALSPLLQQIARNEAVDGPDVEAAFLAAGIPEPERSRIIAAARQVSGGRPLAIRSSATVEDLGGSSFAGQYRSMLDIDATDELAVTQAVLRVFASLLYPAPRAYRDALGIDSSDIAMAAVMMQMVDTQRAGVVFTQDPTMSVPTIRVEVVDGLGESLVSGKRTPRVHQFPRSGDHVASGAPGLDDEMREILRVSLDIETHAGCPQDIEWAHDDSTLWIVQARPVTALRGSDSDAFDDDPATISDAEFTTEGIGEMLPGVLAPLIWQTASLVVEEGFRSMLDRLGADISAANGPHWLIRRVNGRAALDVGRLAALMSGIPGADARMRSSYFGEQSAPPAASQHTKHGRIAVLAHRRRAISARRRAAFDAEAIAHAADALLVAQGGDAPCEVHHLENPLLLARHRSLVMLAVRAMAAELTVSADAGAIHAGLRALLARSLPADEASTWADRITVPERNARTHRRASAAIFAGPTWDELGMEPAAPRAATDREQSIDELADALASSPRWPAAGIRRRLARRRIEHLADRASQQFMHREETKVAILLIGGEVRAIHQELGRRLVSVGRLAEPDDVTLLTLGEIESLLAEQAGPSVREIDRRRRTLQRHRATPPPPSRWRGMPPEHSEAVAREGVLTGWAASSGRFVGRARRVDDPRTPIGRDEVLVASATDPSWSPILLRCGALVLERGGPLSHAAILAREFGVPAVFNIPGAAETLDGRRLLVDGDAGTVTLLDEDES
jgi:pyruvate,water dikinase